MMIWNRIPAPAGLISDVAIGKGGRKFIVAGSPRLKSFSAYCNGVTLMHSVNYQSCKDYCEDRDHWETADWQPGY